MFIATPIACGGEGCFLIHYLMLFSVLKSNAEEEREIVALL